MRHHAQYSGRHRCFTATSDNVRVTVLGAATQKLPVHISLNIQESQNRR